MPAPELIARTLPREHANGAEGLWWAEYRVRLLSEQERHEVWERTRRLYSHVLEQCYRHEQDSEYCPAGSGHPGVWQAWDYGNTPQEAALSTAGDSHYMEAESLSPLHTAVKAKWEHERATGKRISELRALLYHEWRDYSGHVHADEIDVVKDEQERAEAEFESALKAARLWKAANADTAPQEKVDAIKATVREAYKARVEARKVAHAEAKAELARLEAR